MFDTSYCNSPICAPSRLSFLSGRYVSHISTWHNTSWLAPEFPALPQVLNQKGCGSYLSGKMHLDPNRRYGFDEVGESRNEWVKERPSARRGDRARRAPDDLTPPSAGSLCRCKIESAYPIGSARDRIWHTGFITFSIT